MATGPNPQFRFVRCPKCRRVLPEVPNVPVYRCGGCGALLQAKSREKDAERIPEDGSNHISEDKEPSRLNHEAKPSSSNCSVDYNNDEDQNGYEGCKAGEHEAVDLSSDETHKNGDFGSEDCDMEAPGIGSEAYSSTELVHNEPKDSLPSSEVRAAEEEANGKLMGSAKGRGSSGVATDVSQSRGAVVQGFGSMRSRATSGGVTEYASPESEFSCKLRDGSKSPTARSSRAYDGSISSYDGLEDQFPDRYTHHKLRRDRFLVDSMTSIDSQLQHQPKTNLYDINENGWDRDQVVEPARPRRPPRNSTRAESPKMLPRRRSFQAPGYGSGSSFSSRVQQDYKWESGFSSSGKLEYQRQEKMKLLRVIRELQDQLDRSCNLEGNANGRVSVASCYDHQVPIDETWHESMHPASRLGCNIAQQSKLARMSFSGEAPNSRHRQCLHCHPQDWKHSAPLPPVLCHSSGSGYACCNPESSSPQRYMEPAEFSSTWSRETKSGDQRLKDQVMRKYMREKPVVAKKHLRPKAGGAPFIRCYRCSILLQLPEDFLLFKSRYYKLRCDACSAVLKFSVQNRTHIIPYSPDDVGLDPPPSEADESSGVMNRRSTASSYHAYSEHSRLSHKSCSIEGDLPDNASRDRKMYHASSLYSMEKRKEQIRDKYKDPVEEAYGSARPSSSMSKAERFSSETQVERLQRSSSPLHRLMGYSSPSLVIRGIGTSPAGTGS